MQKQDRPGMRLSRRSFLKWSAAAGGATAALSAAEFAFTPAASPSFAQDTASAEHMVRTCCPAHNCGGRCPINAVVKDGVVVRLESDDRTYDELDDPRILACVRGKSYRRRLYHPDRLKTPMKRVGERGEGKFEPISWEEAIDLAASEIKPAAISRSTARTSPSGCSTSMAGN
jgi:anaerobic dimethyl sulfoxide reductase subunit A